MLGLWEQERELLNVKQSLGSPSRTGWVVGHSVEAEHRAPACCNKSMGRDLPAGGCWMGSVEGPWLTRVNSTRPDKVKEVAWCFIDPSHGSLEGKDTDVSPC